MKNFLNTLLLVVLVSAFFPTRGLAQCTYTAVKNGSFSDPTVFVVSGGGSCGALPTSGTAAELVINGFDVVLDRDYVVGKGGSLTIANGGSLMGGANLQLGDGTGSQSDTFLELSAGSLLQVGQLTVSKASILIDINSTLSTQCNLVLLNSEITDNNAIVIFGNLDLSLGGANNTLCGSGKVAIRGCVFGGNGASNRIVSNCAGALAVPSICAQQQAPVGCPGPRSATNATEASCDALVTTSGPACAPLPVALVAFTAEPTARLGVALRWATAAEKNNAYFEVERSADGRAFRAVGRVAGAGTTSARTSYELVDEQPLPGTSYYRLRQTDQDGTAAYSLVRAVTPDHPRGRHLDVYPGRSGQEWVVSSRLPADLLAAGPAVVQVLDALGRVQAVSAVPEAALSGRWTLDLHTLPTGLYVVRLLTGAGTFTQRIAK